MKALAIGLFFITLSLPAALAQAQWNSLPGYNDNNFNTGLGGANNGAGATYRSVGGISNGLSGTSGIGGMASITQGRLGSSNPAEAYMNGLSNLIRSQAQANLINSQADMNQQQVQSMKLQNGYTKTRMFWAARKLRVDGLEYERTKQSMLMNDVRQSNHDYLAWISEHPQSPHLSPADFQPTSGAIAWPPLLQDSVFAANRNRLDAFFLARAEGKAQGLAAGVTAARQLIRAMQSDLTKRLSELDQNDYIAANRFLEGLATEACHATSTAVAAATPPADAAELAQAVAIP